MTILYSLKINWIKNIGEKNTSLLDSQKNKTKQNNTSLPLSYVCVCGPTINDFRHIQEFIELYQLLLEKLSSILLHILIFISFFCLVLLFFILNFKIYIL